MVRQARQGSPRQGRSCSGFAAVRARIMRKRCLLLNNKRIGERPRERERETDMLGAPQNASFCCDSAPDAPRFFSFVRRNFHAEKIVPPLFVLRREKLFVLHR